MSFFLIVVGPGLQLTSGNRQQPYRNHDKEPGKDLVVGQVNVFSQDKKRNESNGEDADIGGLCIQALAFMYNIATLIPQTNLNRQLAHESIGRTRCTRRRQFALCCNIVARYAVVKRI